MPDFVNDALTGDQFESSVRQVARQLYRGASSTGSIKLDGRERDDIINTGTELIIVEATKVRKLDKVEYDLKKSIELVRTLKADHRFSEYNYRILLVTLDDPTADQNEFVNKAKSGCPKEIISFTTLFSRLFDSRHYIRLRGDHSFGSVRNPANDKDLNVPPSSYIATALSDSRTGLSIKAADLASDLRNGGRHIIYGDYGSGKSMTLRDVYFRTRDAFISGKSIRCPVYLNLREHIAQTQPDEALYRHAEKIGFPDSHSLISAWRAGFVALFLDGFDELTPPQFATSGINLKQARRFAVELVSRFFEQTPSHAPIVLAGRESYFDSRQEAQAALGYSASAQVFDLAGFTDADIERFLKTKTNKVPSWLPTRPLLLGYLANTGLFKSQDELLSLDPSSGWSELLQRVCEREVSQIWGVGFEAADLRLFIEGLATKARKSRDGKGLEDSDLREVFRAVFGRDADEPANLLTLRLPGLGALPGRPGAREFIDADFADAAGAGDLGRFVEGPFVTATSLAGVVTPLGSLGRDMVSRQLPEGSSKLSVALAQSSHLQSMSTTSSDLISMLIDRQEGYSGSPLTIKEGSFDVIVVDPSVDLSGVTFQGCIISTLELGRSTVADEVGHFPTFLDCMLDKLEGAVSSNDLPFGKFVGTTSIETFSAYSATNDAVMKSSLSAPVKVLLTVLRKLFMQRGTGRQYSALRRGLPPALVKYVDPITALVRAHKFAEDVYLDRRTILVPNRTRSADAFAIINGPNTSTDQLLEEVRAL